MLPQRGDAEVLHEAAGQLQGECGDCWAGLRRSNEINIEVLI